MAADHVHNRHPWFPPPAAEILRALQEEVERPGGRIFDFGGRAFEWAHASRLWYADRARHGPSACPGCLHATMNAWNACETLLLGYGTALRHTGYDDILRVVPIEA